MRKRSHNNLFGRKNLRIGDMKRDNICTHRERGTKSITLLTRMQQLQIMNNQQPLQKVTKSLYIVTHLGQLLFRLFTQMARTWALKEDSVNMSIIHWYSTVRPRVMNNGSVKVDDQSDVGDARPGIGICHGRSGKYAACNTAGGGPTDVHASGGATTSDRR